MCYKGFLKRILPFFLTFALGLLIASFFVTIKVPNFNSGRQSWRYQHREYDRRMELENQRLREENTILKRQLAERQDEMSELPPLPPLPKKVPLVIKSR